MPKAGCWRWLSEHVLQYSVVIRYMPTISNMFDHVQCLVTFCDFGPLMHLYLETSSSLPPGSWVDVFSTRTIYTRMYILNVLISSGGPRWKTLGGVVSKKHVVCGFHLWSKIIDSRWNIWTTYFSTPCLRHKSQNGVVPARQHKDFLGSIEYRQY